MSQSFRSFILKLCSDTFIELNKDGKYASVYLELMNGYKDKNKNDVKGHLEKKTFDHKTKHKWSEKVSGFKKPNIHPIFTVFTNDQLLCLYQHVFSSAKTDQTLSQLTEPTNQKLPTPVEEPEWW